MNEKAKINVWGSRGSNVQTDFNKKKYGLETTCISIETEKEIIIIDAGSGIINFDKYFYRENLQHKDVKLFFTHYHYDHIIGLPFTKLIYDENVNLKLYGSGFKDTPFKNVLKNFFSSPYFPIEILNRNNIEIDEIKVGTDIELEQMNVKTISLNHSNECVGYKFKIADKSICVMFDYEYREDKNKSDTINFLKNSDLLIIDSYFTDLDYKQRWGHSTVEDNISLINENGVKKALLTHHNADYVDSYMEDIENKLLKNCNNICFARDYMEIKLL